MVKNLLCLSHTLLTGIILWGSYVLPANATAPLFASGHYFDGKLQRPFLAYSQDSGKSWEYPPSINQSPLPGNFMDGELSNTICNKDICIAIGAYYNNEVISTPLIVESRDKGSTWSWPDLLSNPALPAKFHDGWFNNATCTKTSCFVAGLYHDDIGSKPFLAMKTNNSITWNYVKIELPSNFQEGWFTDIDCNNATCIAVGTWSDAQNTGHALLAASKDNGETWQTKTPSENSIYPSGTSSAFLYSATCNKTLCIAAGDYTQAMTTRPLLTISRDNGNTWTSPTVSLPDNFQSGWFSDTDCNQELCIASGAYSNGHTTLPLLFFSNDNGKTWTSSKHTNKSIHINYGTWSSATCSDKGCIAAGSFENENGMHPFIAVSDNGTNWHYPPSAIIPNPSAKPDNGFFSKVTCIKNTCTASGSYRNNAICFPLLAVSNDYGNNWVYPESVNDPKNLPPDFVNGHF